MTFRPQQRPLAEAVAVVDAEFEPFLFEHYPRLIRLANLVCRNQDQAQDAVQSALERAWRGRASLKDTDRFKVWLDRIVVRESIRQGGQRFRFPWSSTSAAGLDHELPGMDSTRLADDADLKVAFRDLPAPQRAVVALHLWAGYTLPECADVLNIPLETARSRMRLSRERLRRALEEKR